MKIQAMSNSNYAPVKIVRLAFMKGRLCKSTFHMHIYHRRNQQKSEQERYRKMERERERENKSGVEMKRPYAKCTHFPALLVQSFSLDCSRFLFASSSLIPCAHYTEHKLNGKSVTLFKMQKLDWKR